MEIMKGHKVCVGEAEGEAVVFNGRFSFAGGMNPLTGRFSKGHVLEDRVIAKKVFLFSTGRGSSQGAAICLEAKRLGNAPSAIICQEADPVTVAAAILADIPTVDRLDKDPFDLIETGDFVRVDGTRGTVEVRKKM